MKQCPINKDLDCEGCRMNFGPGKCGIFSLAADMSYQTELLEKVIVLLEKSMKENHRRNDLSERADYAI
jgi:hypothetical protein